VVLGLLIIEERTRRLKVRGGAVPAAVAAALLCLWSCGKTRAVGSAYSLEEGAALVYRVDYTSRSATDIRKLLDGLRSDQTGSATGAGVTQSFVTRISGDLVLTVIERVGDGYRVAFRFRQPAVELTVNGRTEAAQAEIIGAALCLEIFAEMASEGRLTTVSFDPDVDSVCRNYARAILAMAQVVLAKAPGPDMTYWEADEDDPGGFYLARYELLPDRGRELSKQLKTRAEVFRKAKLRYRSQPAMSGPGGPKQAQTRKPEGSLEAVFDAKRGRLVSIIGEETQHISISGTEIGSVIAGINMRLDAEEAVPPGTIAAMREVRAERLAQAPAETLSFGLPEMEQEAASERTVLGKDTLGTLLEDLSRLEKEKEPEITPLYLRFKALVYLHPESCGALAARAAAAEPGGTAQQILVGALSAVGTEPAQAALVGLLKDGAAPSKTVMLLIQSLGLSGKPATPATQAAISGLAAKASDPEVSSVATLALGMIANGLAASEPGRAADVVNGIIADIVRSESKERTRLLLLALGNSGSNLAWPVFRQYLKNEAASLRSVAAAGLRWVQAPGTDDLLAEVLTGDKESSVRTEAAFGLSFREPTPATLMAQVRSFKEDESVVVRLTVLRNLWEKGRDDPEIVALIREAARADRSPDVRKRAAELIASLGEGHTSGV
jgi:HEAT repeat protein